MKFIGYSFIVVGIALLLYVAYSFFQKQDVVVSPIPEEKGVKVIFVTPTK